MEKERDLINEKFISENFVSTEKLRIQANHTERILKRLEKDQLFVDQFFDSNNSKNLFNLTKNETFEWKRPKELTNEPTLGIGNSNCYAIQGHLDNCGLISACDSISKYPFLLENIFYKDAELLGPNYRGYIKLKFWIEQKWEFIYIDDLLPTLNGKLYYSRCKNANNYWMPLIEKGFAKLMGGYQNLNDIDPVFAFTILTGGLVLRFNTGVSLQRESIEFYLNYYSCKSHGEKYLIGTVGSSMSSNNSHLQNAGHSFSLSEIIKTNNTILLKVRNCQTSMKIKIKLSKK